MSYCDGKWTPVIIMITINSALGLGNAMVKKVLDGGFNHMVIETYRLAISTVCLAPIAFFWERKTRPKLTLNILVQLFFSALIGASLTQYFFLMGLSYTSATLACAFISMSPAVTFVMSLIFRVEKLNIKSKAGVGMVMGTLICIGGAFIQTTYKGVPLTKLHKLDLLTNNGPALKPEKWITGCVLLFAGSSCFGSWMGAVAQGICTVGTSWCIRKRGPTFTSVFTPVGLIFATLFDFSILHRQICMGSVIGSGIVIFGLYIFLLGKVKQMKGDGAKKLPSHFGEEEREDDEQYKKSHLMVVPMTP
ncbi:WAT1-related protein At4g01440 isoform X3 [Brassica napus]|uniref:WAT1-related protein At4g01440 isoform X3 n=1 Tax=Brassica napus TaxID=3708 RepID=UPI0020785D58|nr:WAT1-related protein At4g01440 isoform X3 [Brassica napus]